MALAIRLSNPVNQHYEASCYAKAEPLCRRALAIREKALGPEQPGLAAILYSLAGWRRPDALFQAIHQPSGRFVLLPPG